VDHQSVDRRLSKHDHIYIGCSSQSRPRQPSQCCRSAVRKQTCIRPVTCFLRVSISASFPVSQPQCRFHFCLLPARRRPQGLVVIGVCLSVCLCARPARRFVSPSDTVVYILFSYSSSFSFGNILVLVYSCFLFLFSIYPRRARSASAWILFALWMYVCLYVCMYVC